VKFTLGLDEPERDAKPVGHRLLQSENSIDRALAKGLGGKMSRSTAFRTTTLVVLFFVATVASFAQQVFRVGTASAGPGEKATGFLDVPSGVDPGTRIPVVVVHGSKPGPVLALVAGSHGTEYASIIALEKLIITLDPGGVSGTVILIPLVNLASFEQKIVHVNPVDGKNMNRFYPGKADGTQTERVLWAITKQVVEKCDYLIDYHGGDLDENLRPYSYWLQTGNVSQDHTAKEMVLAFGLDHIIIVNDRPKDPQASKYLDNTAALRGKPTLTVEAGHAGTTDTDEIALLVNGTFNVMRYLKMLVGRATLIEHPVWIEKIEAVSSDQIGIFYPLVQRGSYVEAGMKLGYLTDYFGRSIQDAYTPTAGVVLYVCAVPSMNKGDSIAYVGVISRKTSQ
jgi:predicted deacylase